MKLALLTVLATVGAVKVNPLPQPQSIEWLNENAIVFNPCANLQLNIDNELVEKNLNRVLNSVLETKYYPQAIEIPISSYQPFPTGTVKRGNGAIDSITITIENSSIPLQLGADESYNLTIDNNAINIDSVSTWGSIQALKTLQQLVVYEKGQFFIEGSVRIEDHPNYPHRGVMLDSARNFLSVKKIKEQIDIMSLVKLNVLHWHITDTQLWPLQLESIPGMIEGAYLEREQYSKNDVEDIINYAYERGIRVIPEIDMPGHSRAGYINVNEDVLACQHSWWSNDDYSLHTAVEPPASQLDILNNETYLMVEKIYNEVSDLFQDDVFHVGADELQANCYNYSQLFVDWIKANLSRTYRDLSQYWIDHSIPIFRKIPNRRLMMWEDILTTPEAAFTIPQDVILQSWSDYLRGSNNIKKLTSKGFDVVVSLNNYLYLDCGYGGFVTNDPRYLDSPQNDDFNTGNGGSWCNPYKTWQRIYDFDFTTNLTDSEQKHILGAEAALWSEQVDNTVLTQKLWPRLAALAESVWSGNRDPNGNYRTNWLSQRIFNFREWLVALGYDALPLVPKYCLQNPHACDLYLNQTVYNDYS